MSTGALRQRVETPRVEGLEVPATLEIETQNLAEGPTRGGECGGCFSPQPNQSLGKLSHSGRQLPTHLGEFLVAKTLLIATIFTIVV